jgi:putative two-component system response regulator
MPTNANGKSRETRHHRVLIVDDDRIATHILGRLLRRHGYIAAELNDSTKALVVAHRFEPDIALLDFHMPWKNGHEVAADFASDELLCHVPIIFITADAFEQDTSTRSISILIKPFSIEELLACLKAGIAMKAEEISEIR